MYLIQSDSNYINHETRYLGRRSAVSAVGLYLWEVKPNGADNV